MGDEVRRLSAGLLGFEDWDEWTRLPGGRGGAHVGSAGGVDHVVKAYPADGTRGVRERAALAALAGAAGTPRLLAESGEPPLVVMTRLPGTESLADVLLGTDPRRAREGLVLWAEAVAELHSASTPGVRASFAEALGERDPALAATTLADDFATAAGMYGDVLAELGLPPHHAALDELRMLPGSFGTTGARVLSPADTCPDNNLLGPDGMRLLDFEHAELRDRAWDVAYLRAPWPSCWCAWRIPDDAATAAVERYRDVAGGSAGRSGFLADLDLATLGWQAMTPAWFLPGALATDDGDVDRGRPTRRSFVLHRLAAVASSPLRPELAELAGSLHAVLVDRWGEVALELAPAFRDPAR